MNPTPSSHRVNGLRLCAATAVIATFSSQLAAQPRSALEPAVEEQRRLVAADPGDKALWNDLGNLLLLLKDDGQAETAYRMAVSLDAESALAYYNLGLLLQQDGRSEDALASFEAVLELEPDNARAHYYVGAVHEAEGNRRPAIASYARAFELDPDLVFPKVNPSVIDSDLVLEALLHRDESRVRVSNLSTVFEDGARIAEILVPPLPPEPVDISTSPPDTLATRSLAEENLEDEGTLGRVAKPKKGNRQSERGTTSNRDRIEEMRRRQMDRVDQSNYRGGLDSNPSPPDPEGRNR